MEVLLLDERDVDHVSTTYLLGFLVDVLLYSWAEGYLINLPRPCPRHQEFAVIARMSVVNRTLPLPAQKLRRNVLRGSRHSEVKPGYVLRVLQEVMDSIHGTVRHLS